MSDAAIDATDLVVVRGGRRILDGIDFRVEPGGRTLVRGPSGAGKTTLFQVLGLLATPDAGRLRVNGVDVADLSAGARAGVRRDEVGLVFQDFQLVPDLTARENVALPQEHRGATRDGTWLEELFDALDIADVADQYPATLSGGEKQRVATARALANRPSVVVADEPTGQLDPESAERVLDLLEELQAETGAALVLISHDRTLGERFEDVRLLRDGRFVDDVGTETEGDGVQPDT